MDKIIFIKGKVVDSYDDLAWDKTYMKFSFDLPDGSTYVTPEWLSSDAIVMSNMDTLYWGISYEAWMKYDVTTGKVGDIYRNDNHVEFMKNKLQKEAAKARKKEYYKHQKLNYFEGSTLRRDNEDHELLYIEEKYFKNNNDYTFW